MKKMLTLCLFAVSLYAQAQVTEQFTVTPQPKWIKTYVQQGMGYIDTNGSVVLNPEYDELHPFGELNPELAIIVQDDQMGLIDFDGIIVVAPKYDSITAATGFNPNWLMVSSGGQFGFIDLDGNEVVPLVYDEFVAPTKPATLIQGSGILQFDTNKNIIRFN